MNTSNPALERLEDQAKWYSRKSGENQRRYKRLKVVQIVAAALIPFTATMPTLLSEDFGLLLPIATGGLGVLIVVLEGLQGLFQFHDNWTSYRSTAEALKHEKYLWFAKAGHYANANNPDALLAERVESLVSREHAKWVSTQEGAGKQK
jgi:hypothetical protein